MFRNVANFCARLWLYLIAFLVTIANVLGTLNGTWLDDAVAAASLLLWVWLILFVIGLLRGEAVK